MSGKRKKKQTVKRFSARKEVTEKKQTGINRQDNTFLTEKAFTANPESSGHSDQKPGTATGHSDQKPGTGPEAVFQKEESVFTKEKTQVFTDKKTEKAASRSQKNRKKLEKERKKLPKERDYSMQRVFDEKTGKAKYVVVPVEREKLFQPDSIGKTALHSAGGMGVNFLHKKISENENGNVAVETAHTAEQRAEDVYRFAKQHRKGKVQRQRDKVRKLENRQFKADAEFAYRKFLDENPEMKKKQFQKRMQKQRIKREYAKARRKGAGNEAAKTAYKKGSDTAALIAKRFEDMVARNRAALISIAAVMLLLVLMMSMMSSCGSMFSGTITTAMSSTYLSLPSEMDAADLSFTQKEMELQNTVDSIETDHPGYDEYDYNLGSIGHDPYTLLSYLSAVYVEFTAAGVEDTIQELFDAMYSLSTEDVEETRTRTVVRYDYRFVLDENGFTILNPDGSYMTELYAIEEEEEYTVRILRTTLVTIPLETVISTRMPEEQKELFSTYTQSKGGLQIFATPVDYYWYYYVGSYYGYRKNPNTGNGEFHRGVDIAVPTGTQVYAGHDGTVAEASYDSYYGNYVVITDTKGYTTKYAHMDSLGVSTGQSITKGTIIGTSGNTGSSTGSHLHIECLYNGEYYNPLFYFAAGTQTLYGETTGGTGSGNVIPPESYDDETVQILMTEANRYLGMPYTFGGTAPESFDCSGFVCWVFSNSGVHDLPRTTAQGIYDQCTPVSATDAKAGDIIFFTGTYNAGRPVTHVGIYCGDGIMVHCGDPIQYTSINTTYWQSHFYGFGRLN
jgi:murein DD-endopeptidase MepM/ murein hydrolase activator NlpD